MIDLMAALKKSLGDEKRGKTKATAKKAPAKKSTKEPARKRA